MDDPFHCHHLFCVFGILYSTSLKVISNRFLLGFSTCTLDLYFQQIENILKSRSKFDLKSSILHYESFINGVTYVANFSKKMFSKSKVKDKFTYIISNSPKQGIQSEKECCHKGHHNQSGHA